MLLLSMFLLAVAFVFRVSENLLEFKTNSVFEELLEFKTNSVFEELLEFEKNFSGEF